MGSHYPIGFAFIQCTQEHLRHGRTQVRVRTRAKLINQHQCFVVGCVEKVFHLVQLGAVRREFILYALGIANIRHDAIEPTHGTVRVHRNEQAALKH